MTKKQLTTKSTIRDHLDSMAEEISNEQIKRIKEVIKLHKKSLNLTGLGLTSISKEILGCSDLEELYIGGNHLSSFPPEIFELKHLRILDLNVNELSEIPLSVFSLPNLQSLDASNNLLKSITETDIEPSSNLQSVNFNNNQISSLPRNIFKIKSLKRFSIQSNELKNIPDEIGELVNLERFFANGNHIQNIPQSICKCTRLQHLDLSKNNIKVLPGEIESLSNLRRLILLKNKIKAIPPEIKHLRNLEVLILSENQISILPKEIGGLVSLQSLGLSRNKIAILPDEIGLLKKLKELNLSKNKLTYFHPSIGNLENLLFLNLRDNQISVLPPESRKLKKVLILDLLSNNLRIPLEILVKTGQPSSILVAQSGLLQTISEVKVLVVGQGSVGKTSTINRILDISFDQNESKTEGILLSQWRVNNFDKTTADSKIKLNLWDFGGQEIMHATHQFFLTKRSLYLLVLDSRLTQEENRVEYWLKIVQSFGGESPVLIVGNKIDQHPLDIDRTGLQKKYPNIVGILETSAATGAGIEELKAAITEQVNNMPHVRDLLPETWFTVKTKLEGLGRESNFITHDKYLELCAENEVSDETSQRTLISFLHDLGVILYFQDDYRLSELGILSPQWVTNGVYKIINSSALFQNKGVLTVSMLDEILNLPEYPRGKRLFIVDMMKKFELCYDIEADKTFLVPDLLPKDEQTTDGIDNALAFQYHYAVLPSSVITRFIVRMNEFAHDTVWRSGVVLKDSGNTALVKADTEDRKVFIWVSGDEHKRHDFLSKIRGQFDAIHKTISKLEVKEMVPVPGHPETEPVDYDLLLQMDHNNVEVYPVLSGGKMIVVNVHAMLSGVAREADRQRGNVTNFYIGGDMQDSTIIAGDENEVNN